MSLSHRLNAWLKVHLIHRAITTMRKIDTLYVPDGVRAVKSLAHASQMVWVVPVQFGWVGAEVPSNRRHQLHWRMSRL
jgi:hypothetical protein